VSLLAFCSLMRAITSLRLAKRSTLLSLQVHSRE
jgi:hypothetical protein